MTMYAYVVRGSEDGVFAVTSRKKRAIDMAKTYVMNGATNMHGAVDAERIQVIDEIHKSGYAEVSYGTTGLHCEVGKFEIE